MSRGITNHNNFKTFLTRGLFGSFFRPLLYSKEEKIHFHFLNVMTETIKSIDKNYNHRNKLAIIYWFVYASQSHFELLFIKDSKGDYLIPSVQKSNCNAGRECAYITQAFILLHFEQLLKNSNDYVSKIEFTPDDFTKLYNIVFGEKSKQTYYYKYFKNYFNNGVDPRDRPIIYVYEVTNKLIPDKERQRRVMKKWDNDIEGKLNFINGFTEFLNLIQEKSLKMID